MTTTPRRSGWWSAKRGWQVAAFAVTAAAACWWLLAPIYQPQASCASGGSVSSTGELTSWSTCDPPTSLLAAGACGYVAWFCVLPVVLAALPLGVRGRVWTVTSVVSATGLTAFVVCGGLSLGLFFLPGAVCAIVGAAIRRQRPASATRVAGGTTLAPWSG